MPIRRANAVDAEAIATVLRDTFREVEHLYTRAGYAATTPDASVVRERMKEGPTWIAEDAGFPVGTVSAVLRDLALTVPEAVLARDAIAFRTSQATVLCRGKYAVPLPVSRV